MRKNAKRHVDVFTLGEAARLLCVGARTAAGWADRGWLASYRLPRADGSGGKGGDRRVPRDALLEFAVRFNIVPALRTLGRQCPCCGTGLVAAEDFAAALACVPKGGAG